LATRKQLIDRWKIEPWRSVDRRIFDFFVERSNSPQSTSLAEIDELSSLLDGLPFREEVPSGRDFRGSSFPGARNMTINDADFSYCPAIGVMERVNLSEVRLEEIRGEVYAVTGHLIDTSLARARLRKAWLDRSRFELCSFQQSDLRSANLRGSVFASCDFREANCEGADFQECDLRGCDFRGANLSGAMFRAVTLDTTTDLRGARLVGLVSEELRDYSGSLVLPGTDWRKAMHDDATVVGEDPTAVDRRVLQLIAEYAQRVQEPWATDLLAAVEGVQQNVDQYSNFRWYEVLLESVAPSHRPQVEALMQEAGMDL